MSKETLAGELTETGHRLQQRVYFEDTDFSGVVYHARYLHFMERGRSDFLRLLCIDHRALAAGEIGDGEALAFAVRHMAIDFKRSARIDDVLTIITKPTGISGARLDLEQKIMLDGETLAIKAKAQIVIVNRDGKPRRMPDPVRVAFADMLA